MVQFVLFLFIQITPADVQSGIEQGFLIHQFVISCRLLESRDRIGEIYRQVLFQGYQLGFVN